MITFRSYLTYLRKVQALLKEEIHKEQIPDSRIKKDYCWINKEGKRKLFHLVVLDQHEQKIERIYDVKTPETIENNLNLINYRLKSFRVETDAEVYLAYCDENDPTPLHILSMAQFEKKVKSAKKVILSSHTKIIENIPDFYGRIHDICGDMDFKYFFRGISDVKHDSIPSVYRQPKWINNEDRLYKEAIRRNTTEFTKDMSTFDNLVKMQHYELPTRLLDITSNPLVALYFACQENDTKDGKVLVYSILKEQLKYFDSDAVCVLSNLAKRRLNFDFNAEKRSFVYDIQEDKPSFDGDILEEDAIHEVFCVLPKLNNSRINCQKGAFFIFGMGKTKDLPAALPDRPVEIIIEASAKKDILKELELLGINEASLFPETDKIMKQIKSEFC